MSSFSQKGLLGELEQLVLLATQRLPDAAYAVSIRDEIEARAGITLGRSTIYVTLERLDRKGYVESWFGEPTPERGGKACRYFKVSADGQRALDGAARAIRSLQPARAEKRSR